MKYCLISRTKFTMLVGKQLLPKPLDFIPMFNQSSFTLTETELCAGVTISLRIYIAFSLISSFGVTLK